MSQQPRGLREAHLHLPEHGAELSAVNLADCDGMASCLERIAEAAANDRTQGGWVVAVRARVEGWKEPVWPTASQLHAAAGGAPCLIRSFDQHAVVASSSALRLAGIDPTKPAPEDPPGGAIDREPEMGRPTGLLLESACKPVYAALPAPSPEQRQEHCRLAAEDLARRGYVEAHDMLSRPWLGPALAALDDAGELPLRILLHPTRDDFDHVLEQRSQWERDSIRLGGLKIFTDGTLNSRTAWMLEPFADPRPESPRGARLMDDDEIEEALKRAEAAGLPLVAHAIGDAAVRAVLDAIERIAPDTGGHRVEHAQFIDEQDIPRFARLGAVASVQPCHLLTDIEAIRRLAPSRAHRAFPLRDLVGAASEAGRAPEELIWFGTDAPVVDPDPADNVQASVHRRRAGQAPDEAIAPEQSIDDEVAWRCMRAQETPV